MQQRGFQAFPKWTDGTNLTEKKERTRRNHLCQLGHEQPWLTTVNRLTVVTLASLGHSLIVPSSTRRHDEFPQPRPRS